MIDLPRVVLPKQDRITNYYFVDGVDETSYTYVFYFKYVKLEEEKTMNPQNVDVYLTNIMFPQTIKLMKIICLFSL